MENALQQQPIGHYSEGSRRVPGFLTCRPLLASATCGGVRSTAMATVYTRSSGCSSLVNGLGGGLDIVDSQVASILSILPRIVDLVMVRNLFIINH